MAEFMNKVIVITGAAGNLGRAVVESFLEADGIVCALDRRQGRLEEIFPQAGDRLHFYEGVDSADRAAMIAMGKKIIAEHGAVDVLVNTVGGFTMGERVDEISAETWQHMMDLNVHSFLNASAAFVPAMMAAGHGKVVAVGAGAALKGGAKMGAYSAAKSALLRLIESMAAELKSSHIQVNCVLPGTIDTPQNRQAMPDSDFARWVKPSEIAKAIFFLASPDSDAITGAALPVSGR
jgi:NAD(P)-dependent dehydrogenase (short-subunit alcohol dehydrogenase family)